jgi:Na+-transporting methylmalonyl-CoA/oxaloacetate decarboxylase gamma subunit
MDPITIAIVLVILALGAYLVWPKSETEPTSETTAEPVAEPVTEAAEPEADAEPEAEQVTPPTVVAEPSKRVLALKSAEAVAPEQAPAARKAPTKTDLINMTKSQIEAAGREFGIELDRRLTKDKMITEFQTQLKAQTKALAKAAKQQ